MLYIFSSLFRQLCFNYYSFYYHGLGSVIRILIIDFLNNFHHSFSTTISLLFLSLHSSHRHRILINVTVIIITIILIIIIVITMFHSNFGFEVESTSCVYKFGNSLSNFNFEVVFAIFFSFTYLKISTNMSYLNIANKLT